MQVESTKAWPGSGLRQRWAGVLLETSQLTIFGLSCELLLFSSMCLRWALMGIRGGYHKSTDTRDHYCVRGFRADGHAYKTMHIYSATESSYKRGGGQFGRRYGTVDVSSECENLGYVRFHSSNWHFYSLL
jgi:hypothetical protein